MRFRNRTFVRSTVGATRTTLSFESLETRIALDGHGFDVLIYSNTAGFRHSSIQTGIETIKQLGLENGFNVRATERGRSIDDAFLEEFEAVVFLNTSGDAMPQAGQDAFERFIQAGNGYVGVHAAADTEYDWDWYGGLVGAYFQDHPQIQTATIRFENLTHPSNVNMPEEWSVRDEWYNYRQNPRENVNVLATLDESTYRGGSMGADHPIAWAHEYDGGRGWYTGIGHRSEVYSTSVMQEHLLGGILYASGQTGASSPCDYVGENDGCDIADLDALYAGTDGAPTPLTDLLISDWLTEASDVSNPAKSQPNDVYVLGDVDLDGGVGSDDLGLLLNNFGGDGGWGSGNLNSDDVIDSADLGLLLNSYGFKSPDGEALATVRAPRAAAAAQAAVEVAPAQSLQPFSPVADAWDADDEDDTA